MPTPITTAIGRVGRGNIVMDGIETFDMSGRSVGLKGFLYYPSGTASTTPPTNDQLQMVLAERQRLMGYMNNQDEPVVPIAWECDPTVSGYYRILGAECSFDGTSMETGVFNFTVEAEQVLGYAAPQFQAVLRGAQVPNQDSVTGESWTAYPHTSKDQFFRDDCFAAGTLVLTIDGYCPIEEIQPGTLVLTHNGRWRPVTQCFQREPGPVVRVLGQGHSQGLVVTPDHRFWARTAGKWKLPGETGSGRLYATEPEWAPAKNLREHSCYWASPTITETLGNFSQLLDPPGLGPDPEVAWWVIGRWLADGSSGGMTNSQNVKRQRVRSITITCGRHETEDLRIRLKATGRDWIIRSLATADHFTLGDSDLAQWILERFKRGAANKELPGWILSLNEQRRQALLDGYVSGDGDIRQKKYGQIIRTVSVSKKLALGIRLVAESLGYRAGLSYRASPPTGVIQGRTVHQLDCWAVYWQTNSQDSQAFEDRGYSWARVRAVLPEADQPTYDLCVEEDHSFIAEGIVVHNCRDTLTRQSEDGGVEFQRCFAFYSGIMHYWLLPEDFYVGAGRIEVGSPLELVVGTQIPLTTYNWRISNGLVRVIGDDINRGRIIVQHYNGTSWSVEKGYEIAEGQATNNGFSGLVVLRNSPETVTIRLVTMSSKGLTRGIVYTDLSIRRGDYLVRGRMTSFRTERWRIRRQPAEAATVISGGVRATSNDTDGNRYVLLTPADRTNDLTQGEIIADDFELTWDFAIGSEIGGSGASAPNTAAALAGEYFSGMTERLVVAAR